MKAVSIYSNRLAGVALASLMAMPAVAVTASHSANLRYAAAWSEAGWSAQTDGRCRLVHDIRGYGQAEFRDPSDTGLQFQLHPELPDAPQGVAVITVQSPAWRHDGKRVTVDELALDERAEHRFLTSEATARRLFAELGDGAELMLQYRSEPEQTLSREVVISPIFFATAAREFRDCLSQDAMRGGQFAGSAGADGAPTGGPAANIAEAPQNRVFFATDSAELTAEARHELDRLAQSLLGATQPQTVVIRGHADERGTQQYNARLAERRAFAVRFYLVSQGVPLSQIQATAAGETEPAVSGEGEDVWAENRRVRIALRPEA